MKEYSITIKVEGIDAITETHELPSMADALCAASKAVELFTYLFPFAVTRVEVVEVEPVTVGVVVPFPCPASSECVALALAG